MSAQCYLDGVEKSKLLNSCDVYELAKGMIRYSVERGETIEQLKSGQMGCTLGEFLGFGSVGGFALSDINSMKKYSTDFICIRLNDDREFTYKLKKVFDDIKNIQQSLF